MIDIVKSLNDFPNRHAGKLLLLGLAGVAAYNWRQWRRDRALLARQEKPEPLPPLETWPELPLVSVLVAAWNEAGMIESHIESFLSLRYPHKELILCTGGGDGTYAIARHYQGEQVIVLHQREGEGKQRALRRCFAEASGDVIFLTDADCLLGDDAFEGTMAPVVAGWAVAATGSSRPLSFQLDNAFVASQWAIDHVASLQTPDESPGLLGRNCAIDARVLERIGSFDVPAPSGTDYVLARQLQRSGYTIHYVRASAVETMYPTRLLAYCRQRMRWLRNIIVIGLETRDYAQVCRGLGSGLVAVGLLGMPWLALVLGPGTIALWSVAVAHGVMARIRYVSGHTFPVDTSKPRVAIMAVLVLGADLFLWGVALAQCLLPARRSQWN